MWVSLEQLKLQSRSKSQIQVEMSIDFLSWQEQTFYTCLQTEGLSFTWWACACHLLKEKKNFHCQTKATSTVCYGVLLLRAAAPQWWRAASCGLFEALECCGPWQVGGLLLCAVESLEGHEPGGVEQEGVQVLSMDSSMERRLGATPLDFRQQILHLLNGHQNLRKDRNIRKITDYSFVSITNQTICNYIAYGLAVTWFKG